MIRFDQLLKSEEHGGREEERGVETKELNLFFKAVEHGNMPIAARQVIGDNATQPSTR
jgi:hypothetical protein